MGSSQTLYGISAAARKAGIAEGTLRDYDRRGIVQPLRDAAGRRLFTDAQIQRAREEKEKHARN